MLNSFSHFSQLSLLQLIFPIYCHHLLSSVTVIILPEGEHALKYHFISQLILRRVIFSTPLFSHNIPSQCLLDFV